MDTKLFADVQKIVKNRRPQWTFIIEDTLLRISTRQFIIDWDIFDEILDTGHYRVESIVSHNSLGVVVSLRNIANQ